VKSENNHKEIYIVYLKKKQIAGKYT